MRVLFTTAAMILAVSGVVDDSIDVVCGNGVDDDCDSVRVAPPANHNTTRSNRTSE